MPKIIIHASTTAFDLSARKAIAAELTGFAVVVPGSHGPVEDLYKDPDMGRVLVDADKQSKVIAAVCHGPAAFLVETAEAFH